MRCHQLHLELVTPKKPPSIKIIKSDKAFPASSGRETIEPRKAAKTTYIKRLTKTNNKVLSEKASPIWFKNTRLCQDW